MKTYKKIKLNWLVFGGYLFQVLRIHIDVLLFLSQVTAVPIILQYLCYTKETSIIYYLSQMMLDLLFVTISPLFHSQRRGCVKEIVTIVSYSKMCVSVFLNSILWSANVYFLYFGLSVLTTACFDWNRICFTWLFVFDTD